MFILCPRNARTQPKVKCACEGNTCLFDNHLGLSQTAGHIKRCVSIHLAMRRQRAEPLRSRELHLPPLAAAGSCAETRGPSISNASHRGFSTLVPSGTVSEPRGRACNDLRSAGTTNPCVCMSFALGERCGQSTAQHRRLTSPVNIERSRSMEDVLRRPGFGTSGSCMTSSPSEARANRAPRNGRVHGR
jgi:hypothetical protein